MTASSAVIARPRALIEGDSGLLSGPVAKNAAKASLRSLGVEFRSNDGAATQVLQDINLDIANGEFVSVVGPSGCGKSTLLRVLSGLVPARSGAVTIDGRPLDGTPAGVGFMFQRDTLLPWATIADNIRVGLDLSAARHDPAAAADRVRQLVSFLRLSGFENHRPHQISGGMRQRVALGRLLAYDPDLYLMDEPFGALDSQTKQLMGAELLRVWAAHRRSVLFITHDIEEAVALSDRVVVLTSRPGRVKLDLSIDLPRPRDLRELKTNRRFGELCELVWNNLELQN